MSQEFLLEGCFETNHKVTAISYSYAEFSDDDFKPPFTYYFKNALGDFVFLKGKDRLVLQKLVDVNYGSGKYKLCAAKQGKGGRDGCTAFGTATRKSQKKPN